MQLRKSDVLDLAVIETVTDVSPKMHMYSFPAAEKDNNTHELKQLVGNKDLQGNTVLHMAALNNDVKTAELCLDHGADVNTKKSKETTPLHIAATKGNLEMAELLISRGAGVNMKDGDSKAPLHR